MLSSTTSTLDYLLMGLNLRFQGNGGDLSHLRSMNKRLISLMAVATKTPLGLGLGLDQNTLKKEKISRNLSRQGGFSRRKSLQLAAS